MHRSGCALRVSIWMCAQLWVSSESQNGCVHRSGCALRVSRWMCAQLWVCAESVKMDVCIDLGVR